MSCLQIVGMVASEVLVSKGFGVSRGVGLQPVVQTIQARKCSSDSERLSVVDAGF